MSKRLDRSGFVNHDGVATDEDGATEVHLSPLKRVGIVGACLCLAVGTDLAAEDSDSDIRGVKRDLSAEPYSPESSRYLSFAPTSRKEREIPRISCTQPWTHPRVRLSLRKGA
jgi:hypothetical protein